MLHRSFACFGILTWDELEILVVWFLVNSDHHLAVFPHLEHLLQRKLSNIGRVRKRKAQQLDVQTIRGPECHWCCFHERRDGVFGQQSKAAAAGDHQATSHYAGSPSSGRGAADSTKSASHKQEWVAFNFVHYYRVFLSPRYTFIHQLGFFFWGGGKINGCLQTQNEIVLYCLVRSLWRSSFAVINCHMLCKFCLTFWVLMLISILYTKFHTDFSERRMAAQIWYMWYLAFIIPLFARIYNNGLKYNLVWFGTRQ